MSKINWKLARPYWPVPVAFVASFAVIWLIATAILNAAEINDLSTTDASNTARFPENMAPSAVNDGARALEGLVARWHNDTNCSKASTGSANAYVFAANQTLTAYYDGLILCFDANFANTGAATINVDALGAKTIKKLNDQDLVLGDIEAGQKVLVVYDGTNFQLLSATADPVAALSITNGDLALNAVTGANIAMGSDAQGDVLYYDGTDYARLGAGTSGQFLQTQGAGANPQWATAGVLLQLTGITTGSVATGTGTVPFDDTIPQCSSEGNEYMSFTLPTATVGSVLYIDVDVLIAKSASSGQLVVFLCEGSTADALAVTASQGFGSGGGNSIHLSHIMESTTTGPITFKVRAGNSTASTQTFNGSSGSRLFGGSGASRLRVIEAQ